MKINILEHRAGWCDGIETFEDKSLQNTKTGFINSFARGNGVETDLRDSNGIVVISHNMPIDGEITFEELLQIYKEYPKAGTLALNVKADGLQVEVISLLKKHSVTNYFMFDMSIPDHIGYIANQLETYIRHSEFEQSPAESSPAIYEKSAGIWLDQFINPTTGKCPYTGVIAEKFKNQKGFSWITEEVMEYHLQNGKDLALVSPELHIWGRDLNTRPYQIIWQQWKNAFNSLAGKGYKLEKIQLCTDFPAEAMGYFV